MPWGAVGVPPGDWALAPRPTANVKFTPHARESREAWPEQRRNGGVNGRDRNGTGRKASGRQTLQQDMHNDRRGLHNDRRRIAAQHQAVAVMRDSAMNGKKHRRQQRPLDPGFNGKTPVQFSFGFAEVDRASLVFELGEEDLEDRFVDSLPSEADDELSNNPPWGT